MTRIAILGLGAMGRPMAEKIRSDGHEVMAMDVAKDARAAFPGAIAPDREVLSQAEVVITMLPEGAHVRDAYDEVVLPGASVGALLIDCSTIDVETAQDLNKAAAKSGFAQIDAPVSGGPEAAGSGQLSFMVGGRNADVERAQPLLKSLGRKITHFGAPGSGQAAKACHNMICGITAMAVLEGFALAEALGLNAAQFHALCSSAAAQSWTLENRCPIPGVVATAPASNGYAPGFAARLMAKDLRLAQMASTASGQVTPFGEAAAEAFTAFTEETGGNLDFSSYYRKLRP